MIDRRRTPAGRLTSERHPRRRAPGRRPRWNPSTRSGEKLPTVDPLAFVYRHGAWIAVPAFAAGVYLLVQCIGGMIRSGREAQLFAVPLADSQQVAFAEPGKVVLQMEGPLFSRRMVGLKYALLGPLPDAALSPVRGTRLRRPERAPPGITDGMGASPEGILPLEVSLQPRALVAAWRPGERVLVLPVGEPVPAQRRVEARIRLAGLGATATISGRVVRARRRGGARIEVEPDDARVEALERLVAAAAGAPRPVRLVAALPAVVHGSSGPTHTVTENLSAGGCRLAWTGPAPRPGTVVTARVGYGSVAAKLLAEFRWAAADGSPPAAGVCFLGGELETLERMLATLRHLGAPAA